MNLPERLVHLRRLLLIHSYLYYIRNHNLVSDHQWDAWARELVGIQDLIGWRFDFYDEAFRDWTGDTGMHLPADDYVCRVALRLERYEEKLNAS